MCGFLHPVLSPLTRMFKQEVWRLITLFGSLGEVSHEHAALVGSTVIVTMYSIYHPLPYFLQL
jgi:hypothetical protein